MSCVALAYFQNSAFISWDEFSHWLPSARFLYETDGFPDAAHPHTGASFPAYPYGWPLLIYLGSKLAGTFLENIGPLLNLLMLLGFGIVLVTTAVRRTAPKASARVGWAVTGTGMLAVTILNPSFVQKLVLTSYSETSTMVSTGLAALLAWQLLDELADRGGRHARMIAMQFSLAAVVMVTTRQANIILLACVVLALLVVGLRDPAVRFGRLFRLLVMALVLPLVVYFAWRVYVAFDLRGMEFKIRPIATWSLGIIPDILARMALVASKKSLYFAVLLIILGFGIKALVRCRTSLDRLALLASAVLAGYNVFLLFSYVAAFGKFDALRAASYWRYNTHAGLVLLTFVVVGLTQLWRRWPPRSAWRKGLSGAAVILVVAGPFGFVHKVRFDLEPPKPHFRAVAEAVRDRIPRGASFYVLDPHGSGEGSIITRFHLWPGRQFVGHISAFFRDAPKQFVEQIRRTRPDFIVVHSTTPKFDRLLGLGLNDSFSYLLARDGTGWHIVGRWPYRWIGH